LGKKVTSWDVAKAAGVSQSTVSLVLNNVKDKKIKPKTRAKVLEVARKLNYRINVNARNMKSRKAGSIGLLSSWDAHTFVFPPVIKGVQSVCSKKDIGVVICTGKPGVSDKKDYIDYYLQNRIDGLVYVSYVGVPYEGIIEELITYKVPFVCVIGARDIPGVSCADVSFLESGYMAVNHLAEKGYKNIAYVLFDDLNNLVYAEKERYEGCLKAALSHGIRFSAVGPFMLSSDEETCIKDITAFLKANEYDAVISTSYMCFLFLKAAARAGINVPDSVGVISLDNDLFTPYLYPSLTTVDEPLYDIAVKAVNILLEKIEGDTSCHKLELAPHLTVRESTARNNQDDGLRDLHKGT
jgi:DNA-binding LacI/PurR family transcriptional regulator